MSLHYPHDLEREFESFIANIGADDDGKETAYLYARDSKQYIGCVKHDPESESYTWHQDNLPTDLITEQMITDIQRVVSWLKDRELAKHGMNAEAMVMIDAFKREGGAE